jgi:hypothetical protein
MCPMFLNRAQGLSRFDEGIHPCNPVYQAQDDEERVALLPIYTREEAYPRLPSRLSMTLSPLEWLRSLSVLRSEMRRDG